MQKHLRAPNALGLLWQFKMQVPIHQILSEKNLTEKKQQQNWIRTYFIYVYDYLVGKPTSLALTS